MGDSLLGALAVEPMPTTAATRYVALYGVDGVKV